MNAPCHLVLVKVSGGHRPRDPPGDSALARARHPDDEDDWRSHVGGSIDPITASSEGHLASDTMRRLSVDLAFLSSPGWSVDRGLTSPTEGKRDLKRTVMDVAESSFLLADSTKYGQSALIHVCALGELDGIISDDGLRAEVRDRVRAGVGLEDAEMIDDTP